MTGSEMISLEALKRGEREMVHFVAGEGRQ